MNIAVVICLLDIQIKGGITWQRSFIHYVVLGNLKFSDVMRMINYPIPFKRPYAAIHSRSDLWRTMRVDTGFQWH